jgi:hypothetical protein
MVCPPLESSAPVENSGSASPGTKGKCVVRVTHSAEEKLREGVSLCP